jgi:hypothetical protein
VKHPRWIDLTLSAGADVPLLLQGEGQQGEVCHLQFVMLTEAQRSEASTQRTGFLSGARNDKKGARTFVFCNNQQKTSAESCSNTYALSTRPQYFAPLLLARAFLQRLHIMPLNIQPLAHPCAILTHRSRPYSLHHREYLDSHRNCSARNQFYVPFS